MLYRFLLVILVIDSFILIVTILLQAGKGTGLAANFGGASSSPDAFIGIRQAGNLLTKATWWCAGIFLALAFVMQVMSTRTRVPRSVLEQSLSNTPAPAAPPAASPNTAVPLTPVPQGAAPATAQPGAQAPATGAGTTAPPPPPTKR